MTLYIYSDESGTFDYIHNDYFIFGGIICLGDEENDKFTRKYACQESNLKKNMLDKTKELKACILSNKKKASLFRCLNNARKFAVIIEQKKIRKDIYNDKKHKQRFLDFVYKIAVKSAIKYLIDAKILDIECVKNMKFYCDEHHTATDGIYELKESLYNEFKIGTYTNDFTNFRKPLFSKLETLEVKFCNSKDVYLVRGADIIANKIYYLRRTNTLGIENLNRMSLYYFPYDYNYLVK